MSDGSRVGSSSQSSRYLAVALVGLVVGVAVAPVAWNAAQSGPDATVSVIAVEGSISGSSAQPIVEDLREARQNDSIKAVVLDVNSPGGGAAASESLYLAVRKTAEEMPVVASVTGTGASGAYYTMAPADEIYVTPGSLVGSVGVRTSEPIQGSVSGQVATGPDKLSGYTVDEVNAQVETLRRAFVDSVFAHRADELTLTREQVSHAKVYTGAAAVQNGMADEIGGTESAIQAAADSAGLNSYAIVREESATGGLILLSSANGERTVAVQSEPIGYADVDSPRFLMLYGEVETRGVTVNESR